MELRLPVLENGESEPREFEPWSSQSNDMWYVSLRGQTLSSIMTGQGLSLRIMWLSGISGDGAGCTVRCALSDVGTCLDMTLDGAKTTNNVIIYDIYDYICVLHIITCTIYRHTCYISLLDMHILCIYMWSIKL